MTLRFQEREIMNRIKRINLQLLLEMKYLSQIAPSTVKEKFGCDDKTIEILKNIKKCNIMKLAEGGRNSLFGTNLNKDFIKTLTEDRDEFKLLKDSKKKK